MLTFVDYLKKNIKKYLLKFNEMKRKLNLFVWMFLCFYSYLMANPIFKTYHKNKTRTFNLVGNSYKRVSSSKNNYTSFASYRSGRKVNNNRFYSRNTLRKSIVFSKSHLKNNSNDIAKSNLKYFASVAIADSFFKLNTNENKFLVTYTKSEKGQFKYKVHVEGCVKIYEGSINSVHTYTYVSMNSAITPDKYIIVPVNKEGHFSSDIEDDSIGSISIIKRGCDDKVIPLKTINIDVINSYSFDINESRSDGIANATIKDKCAKTNNVDVMPTNTAKVYFDFNKSILKEDTKQMLDKVIYGIKQMNNLNGTVLEINGYADKKGSKAYNLYISKMRSLACKNYLESHGLKNVKIKLNAMGASYALNDISENNENLYDNGEKDRRVDLVVHLDESVAKI